jgi:ppGpp synthetase/RelA/SpoT-type nucleotidyltranferase
MVTENGPQDNYLYRKLHDEFLSSEAHKKIMGIHRKRLYQYKEATDVLQVALEDIQKKPIFENKWHGPLFRENKARYKKEPSVTEKLFWNAWEKITAKKNINNIEINDFADDKVLEEIYQAIRDFVGGRICIAFADYMEMSVKFLIEELKLRDIHWVEKMGFEDYCATPKRGYRGIHFHVMVPVSRKPRTKRGKSQLAEVQVKTLINHSWASVSHDLLYKRPEFPPWRIPDFIESHMVKLAHDLSKVDNSFISVKDEIKQILER